MSLKLHTGNGCSESNASHSLPWKMRQVHNNMIGSELKIAVILGDDKTLVWDNWLGLLE